MPISLRSALTTGVVLASASAITFTSTVTPIPHSSAAHPLSASVTHTPVDLLAASQRLLPPPSVLSAVSPEQLLEVVDTPTIAPSPPLIAIADAVDAIYSAVEPWVRYVFDWVAVAAWFIPWVGWIVDDQITVLYNFGENLVNSAVFNTTDWLRGQGSALKNIADWVVDFGLALWTLGLDEINNWIPLPPGLYPPDPPVADVQEGIFGDLVVGASDILADVSNGIWDIWEPIKGGVDGLVGFSSNILDAISWVPFVPLINFQLNQSWELIAKGVDAVVGFAHDMINAGNQFVSDAIDGGGLIAATVNAFDNTLASIGTRGGEAIQAWIDWGSAQIDYLVGLFTPGSTVAANVDAVTVTASSGDADALVADGDAVVAPIQSDVADAKAAGGASVTSSVVPTPDAADVTTDDVTTDDATTDDVADDVTTDASEDSTEDATTVDETDVTDATDATDTTDATAAADAGDAADTSAPADNAGDAPDHNTDNHSDTESGDS